MSGERKIDLSLTPEEALSGGEIRSEADYKALQDKIKSLANVQYPFIDVWNCQAALAWMVFSEDGITSHVERLTDEDMEKLGITEEMLYQAIEKVEGAINISGHYPISEEIMDKLAEALEGDQE